MSDYLGSVGVHNAVSVFSICRHHASQVILEPDAHRESMQITMAEDFGVQGRSSFCDQTKAQSETSSRIIFFK